MTRRRQIVIRGTVAALLLLLFLVGLLRSRGGDELARLIRDVEPADVKAIVVDGTAGSVELERTDDGWSTNGLEQRLPVRDSQVELLLQELFAARIERVVARGQQAWRDLTGNGGAGRIVLRSAGKDVELHVGRVDGRETYVRFGSSFDVYAVKQRLQFFLEQPREYWLLLRVFPTDVSPLDVVFFEVTLPELDGLSAAERSLQLIKDGDAGLERWRATDGTPIDREEAVAIVGAAVDMVAAGFSQRSPEQSARRAGLRFVLADGREYSATISGQGPYVVTPKGAYLPSRGYGSLSYLVDEARLRRMIVPR